MATDGGYYRRVPYAEREALRQFAMAAVTLGAELRAKEDFLDREYLNHEAGGTVRVREVFWFFSSSWTRDRKYRLSDLWKWWNDPAWIRANDGHPLAELRVYADNINAAAAHEAACPPKVMVINGKRHLLIARNASPAVKARALAKLEGREGV